MHWSYCSLALSHRCGDLAVLESWASVAVIQSSLIVAHNRMLHKHNYSGVEPGPWFNIKMSSYEYRKPHCGDKTVVRSSCLVHPGVRDKRRVSEIDLSQPRHETAFWWRHNGAVTSQLTDRIKWPNYPVELIGIYVHINTHNKESLTQRCRRSTNVQLCLIFLYISIWFES